MTPHRPRQPFRPYTAKHTVNVSMETHEKVMRLQAALGLKVAGHVVDLVTRGLTAEASQLPQVSAGSQGRGERAGNATGQDNASGGKS